MNQQPNKEPPKQKNIEMRKENTNSQLQPEIKLLIEIFGIENFNKKIKK